MIRTSLEYAGRVISARRWELALGLLVLGARLSVFGYAGSPLPYYDQWIAEYNNIFLTLRNGGSMWDVLFAPHNEHIIATTRLVSLVGFLLNGYWDVLFLIVVAAAVRALEAVLLFRLLGGGFERAGRIATWVLVAVVFVAPVSGFNLLCGLQVSFYFAELALLGALLCMRQWSSAGRSGPMLVLVSLIGGISMGSALGIPPAVLVMHVADRRKRPGFWIAWGVTVAAGLVYAVSKAGTGLLRTALVARLWFFLRLVAWPLSSPWYGVGLALLLVATLAWLWRRGRLAGGAFPVVLAIGAFAVVNALLIALNRGPADFHIRHWESIALVPLALGAFATGMLQVIRPPARLARLAAAAMAAIYLLAFGLQLARHSWPYIAGARAHRAEALAHYREVFTSGGFVAAAYRLNALVLREHDDAFFDDPVLRFTPHPIVWLNIARAPLPAMALLGPDILPARPPSTVGRITRKLIQAGPVFATLGALLVVLGLRRRRRPRLRSSARRPAPAAASYRIDNAPAG